MILDRDKCQYGQIKQTHPERYSIKNGCTIKMSTCCILRKYGIHSLDTEEEETMKVKQLYNRDHFIVTVICSILLINRCDLDVWHLCDTFEGQRLSMFAHIWQRKLIMALCTLDLSFGIIFYVANASK